MKDLPAGYRLLPEALRSVSLETLVDAADVIETLETLEGSVSLETHVDAADVIEALTEHLDAVTAVLDDASIQFNSGPDEMPPDSPLMAAERVRRLVSVRDEWKETALSAHRTLNNLYSTVDNKALIQIIKNLKQGTCWCQIGIGNPMMQRHSDVCLQAQEATSAH